MTVGFAAYRAACRAIGQTGENFADEAQGFKNFGKAHQRTRRNVTTGLHRDFRFQLIVGRAGMQAALIPVLAAAASGEADDAESFGPFRQDGAGDEEAVLQTGVFVVDGFQAPDVGFDSLALRKNGLCTGSIKLDRHAAGNDAVHREAVAEQLPVEAHPVFLEAHELHQSEGQRDVVGEVAEIAEVIADPFAFE